MSTALSSTERGKTVAVIISALSEVLGEPLPDATEETRLFDELHLDSTSVLSLLMALEDGLDLTIDPESLEPSDLDSVASLADYVHTVR